MPLAAAQPATVLGRARAQRGALHWDLEIDGRTFELEIQTDLDIVPAASGAVPASLVAALSQRCPLRIADPVDPVLYAHLDEIQAFFELERASWMVYHRAPARVEIEAEAAPSPEPREPTGRIAAFFSGGIDSFQLVLDAPDITHLIRIAGMDREETHPEIERRMAAAAADLGKKLVLVRTNLRPLLYQYSSWVGSYGALLGSVAAALSPGFDRIYIAGGPPDDSNRTDGSDARLDHLWSTASTEVRRFGGDMTRVEKLLRIERSEVGRRTLRICSDESAGADNCGRCFKCLRSMLWLEALGIRHRFPTFPRALDLDLIARTRVDGSMYIEDYVTPELEERVRRHPSAGIRRAASRFGYTDWAKRRRPEAEFARRPQPPRVLALAGTTGGAGASACLLAICTAMRRLDERTRIELLCDSLEGELDPPDGISRARGSAAMGMGELERLAAEADLVVWADWGRSLPGDPAARVGVLTALAPDAARQDGLVLACSRRLAAGLRNLGTPADIEAFEVAPRVQPSTPAHARELVRHKSTRRFDTGEPLRLVHAPGAESAAAVVAAELEARETPCAVERIDPGGPASSRALALERADALVAVGVEPEVPVLVAEAMAFGCAVASAGASAYGQIEAGVSGHLIGDLDGGGRGAELEGFARALATSQTGLREQRTAALDAVVARVPHVTARRLLDLIEPVVETAPLAAPIGVGA